VRRRALAGSPDYDPNLETTGKAIYKCLSPRTHVHQWNSLFQFVSKDFDYDSSFRGSPSYFIVTSSITAAVVVDPAPPVAGPSIAPALDVAAIAPPLSAAPSAILPPAAPVVSLPSLPVAGSSLTDAELELTHDHLLDGFNHLLGINEVDATAAFTIDYDSDDGGHPKRGLGLDSDSEATADEKDRDEEDEFSFP
jgi:hypothetical protein